MVEPTKCKLCGEPMPENEQMFYYHGYSGPCPKPPLPKPEPEPTFTQSELDAATLAAAQRMACGQDIEQLSATLHDIYQQEAKRQGDVRHKDAYAELPENVKEFDRVLARFMCSEIAAAALEMREQVKREFNLQGEELDKLNAMPLPAPHQQTLEQHDTALRDAIRQLVATYTQQPVGDLLEMIGNYTKRECDRLMAGARLEEAKYWLRWTNWEESTRIAFKDRIAKLEADPLAHPPTDYGANMNHHCHAIGCTVSTRPEMFMCKRHWFMLSKSIRDKVWATYRPGQCDDRRPSEDYCRVAMDALRFIAQKEGKVLTEKEPELLLYVCAAAGLLAHPPEAVPQEER